MSAPADLTIFVCRNMGLVGGLQTIVLRLAAELTSKGRRWLVACGTERIIPELPLERVVDVDLRPREVARCCLQDKETEGSSIDILSFSPADAARGFLIGEAVRRADRRAVVRFAVGIFHPRDFFRENERPHLHAANYVLAHALGVESLFFMNRECRESHAAVLGNRFRSSSIVPVPIDRRPHSWTPLPRRRSLRIACVGRIVPFKAYNFYIPKLADELRQAGVEVEFDIYGHGSHTEDLKRLIEEEPKSVRTKFKGELPISEFDEVIASYDLFIGMGTAALQAAQLGVPTLLAIDGEPDTTYGFLSQVPFGNVGERDPLLKRSSFLAEIVSFSHLSQAEKTSLSNATARAANAYVNADYLGSVFEERKSKSRIGSQVTRIVCILYLFIVRTRLRGLMSFGWKW
jgi:glycosyltransferase involved in cell wall biosynthesis